MMRVKVFSDFCSSEVMKESFERVFCADKFPEYGPDKELYFVSEGEAYTHSILLNTAMPVLDIPAERVVGLAAEPPAFLRLDRTFVEYAQKHIGIYYIGDTNHLPYPFVEGQCYLRHMKPSPVSLKTKKMSIMVSEKSFAPGHVYRHRLVKEILKTDLPIDIYGRGCSKHGSDPRLMGVFPDNTTMLTDYRFHVCIENFQSNMYFSEKVIDPVCSGTTPVYLGCHNIDDFFPGMIIKLTGDLTKDMQILRDICSEPDKFSRPVNTDAVKSVNLIQSIIEGKVFP